MHLKWRKQMMMFILRASTIHRGAAQLLRRAALWISNRFPEIKAIDRRTPKEVSHRANPASRTLAIFEFGARTVHFSSTTSKTRRNLPFAIRKSTISKASEFII